jgi:hypothetical protein
VLRAARRSPEGAFLGIDADASRMREASARAARPASKGGLPNAWFAVAAAEALPGALEGRVDHLRVTLPWGSLLRAALGPERWFSEAAGRMLRPGGDLAILASVAPRDGVPGVPHLDVDALAALAGRWERIGWEIRDARAATAGDVSDSGSSWAKRLGIPARRDAFVLRLRPEPSRPSYARSSAA